jgi:hypothetical protein
MRQRRLNHKFNVWDWAVIYNTAPIFMGTGPCVDELDWSEHIANVARGQFCLWGGLDDPIGA